MLRAAAVMTWRAGVEILHTMHDALMVLAPLAQLEDAIEATKECMILAGRVIAGFDLMVDVSSVRWPNRYMDEAGRATWDRTMAILQGLATS